MNFIKKLVFDIRSYFMTRAIKKALSRLPFEKVDELERLLEDEGWTKTEVDGGFEYRKGSSMFRITTEEIIYK